MLHHNPQAAHDERRGRTRRPTLFERAAAAAHQAEVLTEQLHRPDWHFGPDPDAGRAWVARCLAAAVAELEHCRGLMLGGGAVERRFLEAAE